MSHGAGSGRPKLVYHTVRRKTHRVFGSGEPQALDMKSRSTNKDRSVGKRMGLGQQSPSEMLTGEINVRTD
jgi:hypothetical protein